MKSKLSRTITTLVLLLLILQDDLPYLSNCLSGYNTISSSFRVLTSSREAVLSLMHGLIGSAIKRFLIHSDTQLFYSGL